jgi:hypothetical protein
MKIMKNTKKRRMEYCKYAILIKLIFTLWLTDFKIIRIAQAKIMKCDRRIEELYHTDNWDYSLKGSFKSQWSEVTIKA